MALLMERRRRKGNVSGFKEEARKAGDGNRPKRQTTSNKQQITNNQTKKRDVIKEDGVIKGMV